MRLYVICIALVLLASSTYGQAVFFDQGESGASLGLGFTRIDYHNSDVSGDGARFSLGNTIKGNFDLDIIFSNPKGNEPSSFAIISEYLLIKQNISPVPLSLGLRAGVQMLMGTGVTGTTSVLGGMSIYRKAEFSHQAGVLFYIGGSFASRTDGEGTITIFSAGFPFYAKSGNKTILYLAPEVAVSEEATVIGFTLGMSFIK